MDSRCQCGSICGKYSGTNTLKSYPNFISADLESRIDIYKTEYERNKIVRVPNFINRDLLLSIRPESDTFKWWNYAIKSLNNDREYFPNLQDPIILSKKANAQYSLQIKNYAYCFIPLKI